MAKAKYTYNEKRKEWYTLVYDGTFTPSGMKHRKRISSKKSSADLEKKVIAFKQSVAENGAQVSCPYTFGEYAKLWVETSKATKEENTRQHYNYIVSHYFNSINHIPLTLITHSHFQTCINEKLDRTRTCQLISLTFKQIIKSAIKDHYLPRTAADDILSDISLPKHIKHPRRPLTPLEKEAIVNADLDAKQRTLISLLYYCGLRKGEVLGLSPDDFNWSDKTLSIRKTWINANNIPSIKPYPKSEKGIRTIPIPDVAINQIKPYIESCEKYLFPGVNTELITEAMYLHMWKAILTKLNYAVGYRRGYRSDNTKPITGLSAHILRHNYCTELCYQIPTISTKKIAQLLGDNENMVLEVYSHIVEEKEEAEIAINKIFS